jgi:hypothetical protein
VWCINFGNGISYFRGFQAPGASSQALVLFCVEVSLSRESRGELTTVPNIVGLAHLLFFGSEIGGIAEDTRKLWRTSF